MKSLICFILLNICLMGSSNAVEKAICKSFHSEETLQNVEIRSEVNAGLISEYVIIEKYEDNK